MQHTESDANMIDIYNRIQGMETKIQKLEADRRALLHDIKTKDAQIGTLHFIISFFFLIIIKLTLYLLLFNR